jgi:hypothetical protein
MGEEQGAARTTISLPRDLKARMDAVKVPVNWSAVAAQAFEAKLLELASKKGAKGMDEVIARMKAAEKLDSNEDYQKGWAAGERWAKEEARPKQLRDLDKRLGAWQHDIEEALSAWTNGMNKGIAHGLFTAIHPLKEDVDRHTVACFWEVAIGDNGEELIEDWDYARGFIEGALDVWEKVEGKL